MGGGACRLGSTTHGHGHGHVPAAWCRTQRHAAWGWPAAHLVLVVQGGTRYARGVKGAAAHAAASGAATACQGHLRRGGSGVRLPGGAGGLRLRSKVVLLRYRLLYKLLRYSLLYKLCLMRLLWHPQGGEGECGGLGL